MVDTIKIEGQAEINKKLTQLASFGKDLRPVFEPIISDFYKSQEKLVFSGTPGKYSDLKDRTKVQKQRAVGFVYPILVWTGRLRDSLSRRNAREAITISRPFDLVLGTKTKYASYLHYGSKDGIRVAPRPYMLINVGGRRERWMRIIETAIQKILESKN